MKTWDSSRSLGGAPPAADAPEVPPQDTLTRVLAAANAMEESIRGSEAEPPDAAADPGDGEALVASESSASSSVERWIRAMQSGEAREASRESVASLETQAPPLEAQ
eukprot:CAMPEP_0119266642 /NCGR_PEP_ID=MMETSP1329-20130426/5066_1 /TAXON_ID=114041 /ORGANISM="Genus nov. species nov., Strain RCC1024" /LENGTH=106 /DNA_ID=CAMNT_0007266531 /DNA_START=8 /DNA_END=325 /DNA_ORIENTATION=-